MVVTLVVFFQIRLKCTARCHKKYGPFRKNETLIDVRMKGHVKNNTWKSFWRSIRLLFTKWKGHVPISLNFSFNKIKKLKLEIVAF